MRRCSTSCAAYELTKGNEAGSEQRSRTSLVVRRIPDPVPFRWRQRIGGFALLAAGRRIFRAESGRIVTWAEAGVLALAAAQSAHARLLRLCLILVLARHHGLGLRLIVLSHPRPLTLPLVLLN